MPVYAILFGLALAALGGVAYFDPAQLGFGKDGTAAKPGQPTALSPVAVGAILMVAGLVSLAVPAARKHLMHLAAVVGLLGTVGGFVPATLRKFALEEVAVKVGLGMAVLSFGFLVLCVMSFVRAAKARRAAAAALPAPTNS